ncbi:hypothetical protein ACLB1M_26135 [Escherichia coli]
MLPRWRGAAPIQRHDGGDAKIMDDDYANGCWFRYW